MLWSNMPTEFSECDECNFIKCLPIDHKYNKDYVDTLEIVDIFRQVNIPPELALIIIRKTNEYSTCDCCNKTKLCQKHKDRAIHYGNYYRHLSNYAMCNSCCWWEVT